MAEEVPGIVRYARIHPNYGDAVLSYEGATETRTFREHQALFVDSTFLSLFDYPLLQGDRSQALRRPQTLLLSASTARKYFGDEAAVGETIDLTGLVEGAYTVAGVFEDVPPNSHLQFQVLLPMEDLLSTEQYQQGSGTAWSPQNFITYLELAPTADRAIIEARITATHARHRAERLAAERVEAKASLQPLTDIHLDDTVWAPFTVTQDRKTVYFLTVIGLITLVVALVNYVNLSTAQAMDRGREVGVRKAVGARKPQLVGQFLTESALLSGLALGLAAGLSLVLLPVVNDVAGVELSRSLWLAGRFWAVILGVFVAGALLSGLYPAFVLSSFRPATALKGPAGGIATRVAVRKALVVGQFVASITLLAGTLIAYAQLSHVRDQDTGFDLEQVLVVKGPMVPIEGLDRETAMTTLKHELLRLPAIQAAGLSATTPGNGFDRSTRIYRATASPTTGQRTGSTTLDAAFASVYGLELAAGEAFREGMVVPDSGPVPALVNEALIRALGFESNEAAIGAPITDGSYHFVIRGVFAGLQWMSAHQEALPMLFRYDVAGSHVSLKVSMVDLPETVAAVEEVYESLFPGNPFNYYFADAAFDAHYEADQRFATLFGASAGIAILTACLGLFGLAALTAARRTKEIGVRKVLGASVGSLVALLTKDFVVLVGIAFVLAVPLAYLYMDGWLAGFAYRIDIGPGVFVLTGLLVLGIALATVSYQAVRAALADPVKSLRYE